MARCLRGGRGRAVLEMTGTLTAEKKDGVKNFSLEKMEVIAELELIHCP